jgi:ergothioneine biosynthesis protein EgtB
VATVYAYRAHVDEAMVRLFSRSGGEPEIRARVVLGLHHEQQHQELLLTDVKYNLGNNPLHPPYREALAASAAASAASADVLGFVGFEGRVVEIGFDAGPDEFCFDNELPRHEVLLQPYALADRLVTNGEFLDFVEAGGYDDPGLWLSDGWAALQDARLRSPDWVPAPLYWRRQGDDWFEYRLSGLAPLASRTPVTHVSFYEADAYARWRGLRLPTEAEWEHAAATALVPGSEFPVQGNFVEAGHLHPQPVAASSGLRQLFGDAWEWTSSAYGPYPGYRPLPGTLGEYNGKFMSNQRVLRGGSCATPQDHVRLSYRNFFYPPDRWQFTGIRLAADA